jgi:ankyrin repeat protein
VDERLLDTVAKDTTICYFFFKDTSEHQRNPVHAMAALLHQLFRSEKGEKVIRYALPAFREDEEKVSQNFEVMWGIIQNIALDPNCGNIVFLLDALDECLSSEQKNLIMKLKGLEQSQNRLGTAKNVKFLITSRPYWNIEKEFDSLIRDIPGIRLKGENQSESLRSEIDLVIKARVKQLDKQFTGQRAREILLNGIQKIENRTYLWLHLIFASIESEPRIDTEMAMNLLRNLPPTVYAAYDAILQKSKDPVKAKKLLNIVVAAVRPLFLKEIGVALYIKEETLTLQNLEFQEIEQFQTTLRDLCGLFVTVIDEKVYLLHQTAKEFLIAQEDSEQLASDPVSNGGWKGSLSVQHSNFVLAEICVVYLVALFSNTNPKIDLDTNYCIFINYSAKNWATHFLGANIEHTAAITPLALSLCDPTIHGFLIWFSFYKQSLDYRKGYGFKPSNAFTIASYLGCKGVVKLLLEPGKVEVNIRDKGGRTPLWWAAQRGHGAIVKLLLETGKAEVNIRDRKDRMPLLCAAQGGHETVIKLLLETSKVKVNAKDRHSRTALWWASQGGHEAVVKLLLETGKAEVNTRDRDDRTPLWWAAQRGHEAIVKLLLETGKVEVDVKDKYSRTPLWCAARGGHEAITKLLLETSKVEVNVNDKYSRTPLWWAAQGGHGAIVKLLLGTGKVEVNIRDIDGQTPLLCAARGGHEAIVKLLLKTGKVEVNIKDIDSRTPLSWAARGGHEAIIKLLHEYIN